MPDWIVIYFVLDPVKAEDLKAIEDAAAAAEAAGKSGMIEFVASVILMCFQILFREIWTSYFTQKPLWPAVNNLQYAI